MATLPFETRGVVYQPSTKYEHAEKLHQAIQLRADPNAATSVPSQQYIPNLLTTSPYIYLGRTDLYRSCVSVRCHRLAFTVVFIRQFPTNRSSNSNNMTPQLLISAAVALLFSTYSTEARVIGDGANDILRHGGDCTTDKGVTWAHGELHFIHGSPSQIGSVYQVCEHSQFHCKQINGIMDQVDAPTVSCTKALYAYLKANGPRK